MNEHNYRLSFKSFFESPRIFDNIVIIRPTDQKKISHRHCFALVRRHVGIPRINEHWVLPLSFWNSWSREEGFLFAYIILSIDEWKDLSLIKEEKPAKYYLFCEWHSDFAEMGSIHPKKKKIIFKVCHFWIILIIFTKNFVQWSIIWRSKGNARNLYQQKIKLYFLSMINCAEKMIERIHQYRHVFSIYIHITNSRESFLYRLLNKALRRQDLDCHFSFVILNNNYLNIDVYHPFVFIEINWYQMKNWNSYKIQLDNFFEQVLIKNKLVLFSIFHLIFNLFYLQSMLIQRLKVSNLLLVILSMNKKFWLCLDQSLNWSAYIVIDKSG